LARWALLCACAECLGIAAAALWYGGVLTVFGQPAALAPRLGVWLLLTLSAVPEGLVLGSLQARELRRFVAGLSPRRWIVVTVLVGTLGWGVGGFVPLFVVPDAGASAGREPGLAAIAAYAAAFGGLIGAAFGAGQALALPRGGPSAGRWILGNALGWAAGLPAIYLAASLGADREGWLPRVLLWAGGGLAGGLCVGLGTGVALVLGARRSIAPTDERRGAG
jgi:hypothetical protein